MNDEVRKAEKFAEMMHEGQVDLSNRPYIEHPKAVASMVEGDVEKVVAFLHDVVEDTLVDVEDIREGFGDEVAEAVDVLTRKKGVSYMDYIKGVKENKIARVVKMADLTHNMDVSRLAIITDADWARVKKYKKAYDYLKAE